MTKAALVDSRTPDANHALSVGDSVLIHRDKEAGEIAWVYIGFQSLPSSIRRKKLIGIQQIGLESIYDGQWFARGISGDFNANAITYNNRPAHNGQERLYSKKDNGFQAPTVAHILSAGSINRTPVGLNIRTN